MDSAVTILADMGEWDTAAALLDRWGPPSRSYIFGLFRASYTPLHKAPQFWALMQREGPIAFWRETGRWPDFCQRDPGDVCTPHRR